MLTVVRLVLLLCLSAITSPVLAEDPDDVTTTPRVSVGAGLALRGYGIMPSLGYAYSRSQPTAVLGVGLVELAQDERLRWVVGVRGTYSKDLGGGSTDEPNYFPASPASSGELGGSAGLRRILNPGSTVEVSPLMLLGASALFVDGYHTGGQTDADGNYTANTEDTKGYSLSAQLGFVFEHELLDGLWLRFENQLAAISFRNIKRRTHSGEEKPGRYTHKEVAAGVGWSPVLQLRMTL